MRIIVLLGAPGSGKGTVASRLATKDSIKHISSGDLLRTALQKAETPAEAAAAKAMRNGELVADDVVGALVIDRLKKCGPETTLLLDGYPRNEVQAASLEREAAQMGAKVTDAVWLEVPEDVLIRRLAGRRVCSNCNANYHVESLRPKVDGVCDVCGQALVRREDDAPEHVAKRLVVYREETAALIDWYESRGQLVRVLGDSEPETTTALVAKAVLA